MSYAILRLEKVKAKDIKARYEHNYRIAGAANADRSLSDSNEEIISLNGKTYMDAVREEELRLKAAGTQKKAVRSDAVLGFELVLRTSHGEIPEGMETDWIQKNVGFIDSFFNPPDHRIDASLDDQGSPLYTDNVKSVVVHRDEGATHIHAFVVPVDAKGTINASYYNSGRAKFYELQDKYAECMKEFGLTRGEHLSPAEPKKMRAYFSNIKEAVDASLPEPLPHETVQEYKERADKVYQTEKSHHVKELAEKDQEINAQKAKNAVLRRIEKTVGKEGLEHADVRMIRTAIKEKQVQEEILKNPDDPNFDLVIRYQQMMQEQIRSDHEQKKKYEKDHAG